MKLYGNCDWSATERENNNLPSRSEGKVTSTLKGMKGCGTDYYDQYGKFVFICGIEGKLCPSCSYPKGYKPNSSLESSRDKDPEKVTAGMKSSRNAGSDISLSDKLFEVKEAKVMFVKDVAEAVRKLKGMINKNQNITTRQKRNVAKEIDKIFGDFK